MNVYSVTFRGWCPVGACAVIVANSQEDARESFLKSLPTELAEENGNIELGDFELIDTKAPNVTIILDGEY